MITYFCVPIVSMFSSAKLFCVSHKWWWTV